MDDDGAGERVVVEAWIESVEPKRVAVAADVAVPRDEQPEAAHVRAVGIRERRGQHFPAVPAVRDELVELHAAGEHVDHPQPPLRRRTRVVDQRQQSGLGDAAVPHRTAVRRLRGRKRLDVGRLARPGERGRRQDEHRGGGGRVRANRTQRLQSQGNRIRGAGKPGRGASDDVENGPAPTFLPTFRPFDPQTLRPLTFRPFDPSTFVRRAILRGHQPNPA